MWAGSGLDSTLYKQTGGLLLTVHSYTTDIVINMYGLVTSWWGVKTCIWGCPLYIIFFRHTIYVILHHRPVSHLLQIVFSSLCCWSLCWWGSRRCPPHVTERGRGEAEAQPERPAGKTLTSAWTTDWNTNTKLDSYTHNNCCQGVGRIFNSHCD